MVSGVAKRGPAQVLARASPHLARALKTHSYKSHDH